MSSTESSSESDGEYITEKNIMRDSFIWEVEKFSPSQLKAFTKKRSPFFHSKESGTVQWQLEIFKDYNLCSNEEYLSVNLVSEGIWPTEVIVLCGFYVLGLDGGKKHKQVRGITKFNKSNIFFSCRHFLKSNLLHNDNNELLPNGNLILGCEIFYYCGGINTVDCSMLVNRNGNMNMLLNDIASMLESPVFSDCVIQVGESRIEVHRCIITARSKVFKSLLEDRLACGLNVINIHGFRLEVVKEMLTYLYTGRSPNMDETALELFEIGHRYELNQLKLLAEESLLYSLSIENVFDCLARTLLPSSKILKKWYLRFVYLNLEDIIDREEWEVIVNNNASLISELLSIGINAD